MIPRELIDTAEIPGGAGLLRLIRRGEEYSIMLGANELMNSRLSGSEEALAQLAIERLETRPRPTLLIGGLGMGFTLRAALSALPPEAQVEVAELVPAVIRWARGPLAHLYGGSTEDPRVRILEADVGERIAAGQGRYDAILLDVDNGPDALTVEANDRLYELGGLRRTWSALRPNGVLAVWSSAPDSAFTARLKRAGFAVEEVAVRATSGGKGAHHVIWLASRRAARR
jgi:spermidine synthase